MPSAETDRPAKPGQPDPWPDRLIRPGSSSSVQLGLRNLYILPSSFGWLWLLACAVLYLMGIGGASSGALLLAYGGLGLFLLAPFLTQFNLQGLELRCAEPVAGFAGQPLAYPLLAHSTIERLQLRARFRHETSGWSGPIPAGVSRLAIPWTPPRRGLHRPGRLRLESRAPLGLFVCWTLWEPEIPQLIYPARRPGSVAPVLMPQAESRAQQSALEHSRGSEDWQGLSPHRPEEGPSRIAWKQLARSGTALSKRFSDQQPQATWLSPDPALPLEQALEHLCDRCCRLAAEGTPFGLVLSSGDRLHAASGERHLQRCLEALALAGAP
jgi:uncharacterized protein (DUF58 family)